ncbi:Zinc finger, C3HC4 type (RING finger) [Musa troglodytarum]|uniref:Zinc finger, C3HC4 type (RING finger) n=1 Tax=Musa troglodytarum TaxID=320322 RepID=A0A9E7ECY8_9LILI|nr:Zinc finger, C3HC4 type (RING finger) [Musa troglodytarum]
MATPLQDSSPFDALAIAPSSFMVLLSQALVLCTLSIFNYAILVAFLTEIPRALYAVPSSSPSSTVSVVISEPDMDSCVICMDEFMSGEELWVLPRCKHLFHGMCIERWLLAPSMTCPVCRKHVIHGEAIAPRSHYINIDTDELHFLVSTSL